MPDEITTTVAEDLKTIQNFSPNNPDAKAWLRGGTATEGMSSQPQTADYQRSYLQNMLGRHAPTMNTVRSASGLPMHMALG